MPKATKQQRLDALLAAVAGARRLLILTHDNPDPDSLASGFALSHLLRELTGIETTVGFSGMIGRAENRAMVRELDEPPEPLSLLALDEFDGIALVDTQPGAGNNSIPEGIPVLVVIDHHPPKVSLDAVRFVDVRERYGATATILAEYLETASLTPSRTLATALWYAIKSETQDLGREATEADRRIYFRLLPAANARAVARIQRARVPRDYFRAFRNAIEAAQVYDNTVFTDLGAVASPDIVAEIADFLLRLQNIDWSCCAAAYENGLVVSLRTTDPDAHAGRIIRRAVTGLGTAGGHGAMAGGQVSLTGREYEEVWDELRRRLLELCGAADATAEPLVSKE